MQKRGKADILQNKTPPFALGQSGHGTAGEDTHGDDYLEPFFWGDIGRDRVLLGNDLSKSTSRIGSSRHKND